MADSQNKLVGFGTKVKDDDINKLRGKYGNENVTLTIGERIYIDTERKQVFDAAGKVLLGPKQK